MPAARPLRPAPPLIAIASRTLLQERAGQLGLAIDLKRRFPAAWPERPAKAGQLYVWDTPLAAPVRPALDRANAAYVLETLTRAGQGCLDGHFAGMITAPVHKGVINEAGIPFSGHTEFLADLTHTAQVVMMLATRGLRVALATTICRCARSPTPLATSACPGSRASSTPTCATSSASPIRASWSADSTRTPAKAVTWAGKRSR